MKSGRRAVSKGDKVVMGRLKRSAPIDWSDWRPPTDGEPVDMCMKSIEQLKEEAEAIRRDPTLLTSWDAPISFNEYYRRLMAGEYDEKA